ncbi:response regulator [Pontibaca salina]|uniref:Response regulator n=1 Tax=Pontibaca salina TaxID=2795731 RepID=A0A934M062_9RHOB|nr:response regulator [Pontibaca salina]MBI6629413.1 response regulator [Pontibaca salina]
MTRNESGDDLATALGRHLPFLRRYGRALTGNQKSGDAYAAATLEAILEDPSVVTPDQSVKVSLFQIFHGIWITTGAPSEASADGIEGRAQSHMAKLTKNTREALLLHTIEEFSYQDTARIMQIAPEDAEFLVNRAREEMSVSIAGRVMIIEDEAIIAMDLESLVTEIGHQVVGIARTRDSAVKLGSEEKPDLILADIQLADNSSGIDAVHDLLATLGDIPVIFITAFPERLLTGERPEPAFLISKPYSEDQVRSAVSQAMFFASTETLRA